MPWYSFVLYVIVQNDGERSREKNNRQVVPVK